MATEFAYAVAAQLPGDILDNLAAIKRTRAARVRRLRSVGMNAREIESATGLTYRQQLYALKTLETESKDAAATVRD